MLVEIDLKMKTYPARSCFAEGVSMMASIRGEWLMELHLISTCYKSVSELNTQNLEAEVPGLRT